MLLSGSFRIKREVCSGTIKRCNSLTRCQRAPRYGERILSCGKNEVLVARKKFFHNITNLLHAQLILALTEVPDNSRFTKDTNPFKWHRAS